MSDTAEIKLEELCQWSAPKRVETRNGPRNLRTAPPTDAFGLAWKQNKEALKAAGLSWSKSREGQWEAVWWQRLPEEEAKVKAAVESSRAVSADIEIPVPPGLSYLPYQRAGIAFGLSKPGVLLGDEMGLGKTIQIIGMINADPTIRRVLIVCPATLKLNWRRELAKWLVRPAKIAVCNSDAYPAGADIVIINYDILHKFADKLRAEPWDLLAVDEAHYMKSPDARRTVQVVGKRNKRKKGDTTTPEWATEPIPARRRIYATGTPIVNRPVEMWPLLSSLDPETWRSFFAYANKFCGAHHNGFGWDFGGATNTEQLQTILRSTIMVRRLKRDVLKELPPKRRQVIELPANDKSLRWLKQERDIEEANEERIAELKSRVELAKVSERPEDYTEAVKALQEGLSAAFTEMSVARHETALAKVDDVAAHVRDVLDGGDKVILFAHHRDVIAAYEQVFKGECVTVVGGMKDADKMAAVDAFQKDDKCRLFIGGITAAGVGLTLTEAKVVVFAELDWVPGNMTQCEDRAHRIGQTDSILVQHLVLEGSMDARMAVTLIEKQEVIDAVMDDAIKFAEAAEPVVSVKVTTVSLREVRELEVKMDPERIAAIHAGLQELAARCDGAREIDGNGFNKFDTRTGKSLAYSTRLTPKMAVLGFKLVNKYRGQLSAAILDAAGVKPKEKTRKRGVNDNTEDAEAA